MPRPEPPGQRKKTVEREFTAPDTGERFTLHEEVPVKQGRPNKGRRRGGFVLLWPDVILKIPLISGMQLRTWAALAQFHNPNTGTIKYSLGEIGDLTGQTSKPNISYNINELAKLGLIVKVRRAEVMLHPDFAWYGNEETEARARDLIGRIERGEAIE